MTIKAGHSGDSKKKTWPFYILPHDSVGVLFSPLCLSVHPSGSLINVHLLEWAAEGRVLMWLQIKMDSLKMYLNGICSISNFL